ncbi:hypothetical protein [Phocaeicola coprocola]|jgi:hypothetical protein|uniref:hypothetical protein n=1 Tax=Phocaeicola coprocola TaxID=310298 RepID=UPI002670503B|nr:hypothetical protein [Phocaeicola coprocola]
MRNEIYLFNPENDMALANFTPYYKAPSEIIRMANDLSMLPAWYAPEGSAIKVDSLSRVSLWREQCPASDFLPDVIWSAEWENMPYKPWGWSPSLLYTLRKAGVNDSFLLSDMQMGQIRVLSGRQCCVKILESFSRMDGLCGKAMTCNSMTQVKKYITSLERCVLKAPWSGSGRGIMYVSSKEWNDSAEGWVSRVLRVQGEIMVEPLYNKVCDFAMEFYADGNGSVSFVGYSLFDTDAHGNYKGNFLLSDGQIKKILSQYIPDEVFDNVCRTMEGSLASLLNKDYCGFLGVDMMICLEDGRYLLHPCVEINLRMNMGVVSHTIFNRYVHCLSHGKYIVKYYSEDGEAWDAFCQMKATYKLHLCDGKLAEGYMPLTPVKQDTHYHAFLLLDRT